MNNEESRQYQLEQLRQSLAWMDLVMAHMSQGIAVVDQDWRIMFCNDSFAKILDAENRIELFGKRFNEVLDKLFLNNEVFDFEEYSIHDTDRFSQEFTLSLKEDEDIVIKIKGSHIEQLDETVILLTDVTEQQNKIEELEFLNKSMVDREIKMIRLKERIRELKKSSSDSE